VPANQTIQNVVYPRRKDSANRPRSSGSTGKQLIAEAIGRRV
jgi:hypothetical protein